MIDHRVKAAMDALENISRLVDCYYLPCDPKPSAISVPSDIMQKASQTYKWLWAETHCWSCGAELIEFGHLCPPCAKRKFT